MFPVGRDDLALRSCVHMDPYKVRSWFGRPCIGAADRGKGDNDKKDKYEMLYSVNHEILLSVCILSIPDRLTHYYL